MITFRPHSREDIPLRVNWLNNEKANIFAIDNPNAKTNLTKENEWFDKYEKSGNKKFFTILHYERPIGFMGLTINKNNNQAANLFIIIGEDDFRGKGYGKKSMQLLIKYAFNTLNLSQLVSEVNRKNIASIELFKSLNFDLTDDSGEELKLTLVKS